MKKKGQSVEMKGEEKQKNEVIIMFTKTNIWKIGGKKYGKRNRE